MLACAMMPCTYKVFVLYLEVCTGEAVHTCGRAMWEPAYPLEPWHTCQKRAKMAVQVWCAQHCTLMKRRTQIYMTKLINQLDLLDLGNNSCSNIKVVMVWASLLAKEGQRTQYFRKIGHLMKHKISLYFPVLMFYILCHVFVRIHSI